MTILKYVLMVLFVLVCIIATVLVLMQEGRSQGLGRKSCEMDEDSDSSFLLAGNRSESGYFLIFRRLRMSLNNFTDLQGTLGHQECLLLSDEIGKCK